MSKPSWLDCLTAADVPEVGALRAAASPGHHVVLRIRAMRADEARQLIARLSRLLPDHSVFVSGGDQHMAQVTVMPVVTREQIRGVRTEIAAAVAAYQVDCQRLTGLRQAGQLGGEWDAYEHGNHCRFSNGRTGQVVEAPLRQSDDVDPYFFAEFVQTTSGHDIVAGLLASPYHDAARMLDMIVGVSKRSAAEQGDEADER